MIKKRRVQAAELKKMKKAVFIWYNPLGNPELGKWRASNALLQQDDSHNELYAEMHGKKIFTQSLEELLLRLVVEHHSDKLLSVTSTRVGEFVTPAYANLLRGDLGVYEVII